MSITLNVIVAVLLVFTIGYCSILYKRLADLRRDRKELEKLAASFNEATERAEASIMKLHSATDTTVQNLQNGMAEAGAMIDDLRYLVERGEATADQLEGAVRAGEKGAKAKPQGIGMDALADAASAAGTRGRQPNNAEARKAREKSEAARELFKALQSVN